MIRLGYITVVRTLLFSASVGLSASLYAESLELPTESPTEVTEFSIQLPGRGMSMETVQNRFGTPTQQEPAVGSPPITKWIYSSFTVYFESEYVIHSVVNR